MKQQLLEKLRITAEAAQQRQEDQWRAQDAEHKLWLESPEGLVEAIKNPLLLTKPSDRSPDERRTILLQEIQKKYGKH